MASYTFKYRMALAPEARNDGSGCVDHDIYALASSDAANWSVVPGRHKTISVPAASLAAALASGTTNQKVTKYKEALAASLDYVPAAVSGWSSTNLAALMAANDAAAAARATAVAFLAVVAPGGYPIDFAM